MNETKETRNIKESTEKSKTKLTKKHAEILTLMNELYEHWGLHVLLITDPLPSVRRLTSVFASACI